MRDLIAAIEARGKRLREEHKALGFTPEAKRARAAGRRARRAGLRFEAEVARYLGGEVVRGSGALGTGSRPSSRLLGDVRAFGLRFECKLRRGELVKLHRLAAEGPAVVADARSGRLYWLGHIATLRDLMYHEGNTTCLLMEASKKQVLRMETVRRWLDAQGADALVHAERGIEDAIVVVREEVWL